MNKELWEKCVKFHGHECPGLAIGFRASEIAKDIMKLNFSKDEEVVCITENDACGVDAIQVITGCTMGKGNLILKPTGKMAFTFISRQSRNSIRVVLKNGTRELNRKERQRYILEAPMDEVFKVYNVDVTLPEPARIFETIICEKCNEGAPEHKIRLEGGKRLCLDCISEYSRGW